MHCLTVRPPADSRLPAPTAAETTLVDSSGAQRTTNARRVKQELGWLVRIGSGLDGLGLWEGSLGEGLVGEGRWIGSGGWRWSFGFRQ
jgi:hypothetical protein